LGKGALGGPPTVKKNYFHFVLNSWHTLFATVRLLLPLICPIALPRSGPPERPDPAAILSEFVFSDIEEKKGDAPWPE